MKPIIRVENLGKQYRIGQRAEAYATLRESLVRAAVSPINRLRRALNQNGNGSSDSQTHIWSLKDVGFEVKPGEVVGIIGRNGAGKSTLLKILSRVTEPTEGKVDLYGCVGSLLEVGTGFHPELTGRENIYLNGAILGMSRREISRNLDAITAFAEIEKFVDTPVKRYSSGMYLRLAFAVAAHLETEILLVDEVLAVGDAAFQKKCLGKMQDVSQQGRTILFVSHNMAAVQSLCQWAVLLKDGRVESVGPTRDLVRDYFAGIPVGQYSREQCSSRSRSGPFGMTGIAVRPTSDDAGRTMIIGDDITINITYLNAQHEIKGMSLCIGIYDVTGMAVTFLDSRAFRPFTAKAGGGAFACRVPRVPLTAGDYILNVDVMKDGAFLDRLEQAYRFTVHEGDYFGTGKLPYSRVGGIYIDHEWEECEL